MTHDGCNIVPLSVTVYGSRYLDLFITHWKWPYLLFNSFQIKQPSTAFKKHWTTTAALALLSSNSFSTSATALERYKI